MSEPQEPGRRAEAVLDALIAADRVWLDELPQTEQDAYREYMKDTFVYQRAVLADEIAQFGWMARLVLRRKLRRLNRWFSDV